MPRVRVYDGHGRCVVERTLERRLTIGGHAGADIVLAGLAPVRAWIEVEGELAVYMAPTPLGAVARHGLSTTGGRFDLDGYEIEVTAITDQLNYEPADATEAELVAALRANPLDDAVRDVYADWLEQHDHAIRARLLRAETEAARPGSGLVVHVDRLAPLGDEAWRAVASRAALERCDGLAFRFRCPKTWNGLTVAGDDRVRHCGTCDREVHYCTSVDDARLHGRASHCIAIDAAVARGAALEAYDANGEMWMGEVAEVPDEPLAWGPGRCGGPDVDD